MTYVRAQLSLLSAGGVAPAVFTVAFVACQTSIAHQQGRRKHSKVGTATIGPEAVDGGSIGSIFMSAIFACAHNIARENSEEQSSATACLDITVQR